MLKISLSLFCSFYTLSLSLSHTHTHTYAPPSTHAHTQIHTRANVIKFFSKIVCCAYMKMFQVYVHCMHYQGKVLSYCWKIYEQFVTEELWND